ncbi:hypothetical protein [Catellatospora paridis]|uniref:hypothetical protein n=1 Tax=Catellatospora paridis TaxID=1617086 RepID=UPI0012D47AAE|nr:hypothetical protein [Catellatospora paridis]
MTGSLLACTSPAEEQGPSAASSESPVAVVDETGGPTSSPSAAKPTEKATQKTLNLPRIEWEGGPAFWKKFPDAADWTDPAFFPVGIWFSGISSDAEAQWDKQHGINFYIGMHEGTNFALFERNDMYWIGDKLNPTFKDSSRNWPGIFMDDEVDGTAASPAEGFRKLQKIKSDNAGTKKFLYTNYTQLVIGSDMGRRDQERYVNDFADAVSLDMYWYTIPFCDWKPYRGTLYADPVPARTCRTASSYGRAVNGLTVRDAVDGRLQPRWMFIENFNGLSGHAHLSYITPEQLKAAAMSSVINEARGLLWFNQSFTGPCQSSGVLREAQTKGSSFCGHAQIEAMGQVNKFIHSLARVINTQSYKWNFGSGLDTMLKAQNGSAYIFAMTDGTTGQRTFKLPPEVSGKSVEVVGENRTIDVSDHSFRDSFPHEYTYHVYRIVI